MAVKSKAAKKSVSKSARKAPVARPKVKAKPVARPKAAAKRPAKPAPQKAAAKVAAKADRKPSARKARPQAAGAVAKSMAAPARRPARKAPAPAAAMTLHKPVAPYGLNKAAADRTAPHGHVKGLTASEKKTLRAMMVDMRERLVRQVVTLKQESLQQREEIVTSEDGTDAFDRQFALTVASSEQDAIIDIDDALRRIQAGNYGVCEACGCDIEKPRLKALPFVRLCIRCQSETERRRPRFRPLE